MSKEYLVTFEQFRQLRGLQTAPVILVETNYSYELHLTKGDVTYIHERYKTKDQQADLIWLDLNAKDVIKVLAERNKEVKVNLEIGPKMYDEPKEVEAMACKEEEKPIVQTKDAQEE